MQQCKKCNEIKNFDDFYRNTRNSTGREYSCKECKKKYQRARFQKVKAREATRRRIRYKEDIQFRLGILLRSRVSRIFKNGSAVRDLGCTIEQFKSYLESKFEPGMTWENYGFYGWHIDHKVPLSHFDLSNLDEFKKACHYTNLQPLWADDNFAKGDCIGDL